MPGSCILACPPALCQLVLYWRSSKLTFGYKNTTTPFSPASELTSTSLSSFVLSLMLGSLSPTLRILLPPVLGLADAGASAFFSSSALAASPFPLAAVEEVLVFFEAGVAPFVPDLGAASAPRYTLSVGTQHKCIFLPTDLVAGFGSGGGGLGRQTGRAPTAGGDRRRCRFGRLGRHSAS